MTTAQPGQEQRMEAIELLARLEEVSGNIAAAFTLRTVGVVGIIFEEKLQVVEAALTRPTADLGEDGERLPDVLRAIVAEWERGNHAAAVVLPDGGPYGFRDSLNQAADRLILYREALERINRRASPNPERTLGDCADELMWIADEARALLSRSGDD